MQKQWQVDLGRDGGATRNCVRQWHWKLQPSRNHMRTIRHCWYARVPCKQRRNIGCAPATSIETPATPADDSILRVYLKQ